jgi:predicted amidohydrolase
MVRHEGHRIGIEICYDVQFPELAAYLSRQGAELILAPTAWALEKHGPSRGLQPYDFLAMATAYAYGVFVAVVNRTGLERGTRFPGRSCLADPWGQIVTLGKVEERRVLDIPFREILRAKRPNPRNNLQTDHRMVIRPPASLPRSRTKRGRHH